MTKNLFSSVVDFFRIIFCRFRVFRLSSSNCQFSLSIIDFFCSFFSRLFCLKYRILGLFNIFDTKWNIARSADFVSLVVSSASFPPRIPIKRFESLWCLKELYTSISTLAQKLVLTLLNNELIFDPVRTKNPQTFSAKKP